MANACKSYNFRLKGKFSDAFHVEPIVETVKIHAIDMDIHAFEHFGGTHMACFEWHSNF